MLNQGHHNKIQTPLSINSGTVPGRPTRADVTTRQIRIAGRVQERRACIEASVY